MAMGKRGKKQATTRGEETPKLIKVCPKSVLDKMSPGELDVVLRALLKEHPDLKPKAEAIAVEMVLSPSVEDIADEVFHAVTCLDLDSLNDRAGSHSWGYVEPTEAAWELLDEAVEDVVADMKRRMELGLDSAAETICHGIVVGLHKAKGVKSDGPLGWAPDFPAEEACHVVAELIRAYPVEKRGAVRDRLVEVLGDLVPEWHEMISRAAESAARGR
ncbi:MAG: hypothetical protein HY897_02520 [Deltaproteobacteria bacterium]|nr:hypothetical protein [Deltaproteobacteria bacterium]